MNAITTPYTEHELLSLEKILAALDSSAQSRLTKLEIFDSLASTNQHVWEQNAANGTVCLAEYQTAGRGQRGRRWLSPYASGLCLSLSWSFATLPPALSLALGVGVVQVLETFGATGVGLKWPNDVVWQGKKLAGLLVESRYMRGQWYLVIGLGLNVYPIEFENINTKNSRQENVPTDLTTMLGQTPSRNRLAAAFISRFLAILANYAPQGFALYYQAWQRLDVLENQAVTVFSDNESMVGIARSVDEQGALLLETTQGLRRFASASVRL